MSNIQLLSLLKLDVPNELKVIFKEKESNISISTKRDLSSPKFCANLATKIGNFDLKSKDSLFLYSPVLPFKDFNLLLQLSSPSSFAFHGEVPVSPLKGAILIFNYNGIEKVIYVGAKKTFDFGNFSLFYLITCSDLDIKSKADLKYLENKAEIKYNHSKNDIDFSFFVPIGSRLNISTDICLRNFALDKAKTKLNFHSPKKDIFISSLINKIPDKIKIKGAFSLTKKFGFVNQLHVPIPFQEKEFKLRHLVKGLKIGGRFAVSDQSQVEFLVSKLQKIILNMKWDFNDESYLSFGLKFKSLVELQNPSWSIKFAINGSDFF